DGNIIKKEHAVSKMSNRQSFFSVNGLDNGTHTLKFTVISGECAVDAAQVLYNYEAVIAKAAEENAAEEQTVSDADSTEASENTDTETEAVQGNAESSKQTSPIVPIAIGIAAAAAGAAVFVGRKKKKK
ncbi:MAG: LPXTG cell wall anchor domain-containing protein, partial [Huintestinicola sp.]